MFELKIVLEYLPQTIRKKIEEFIFSNILEVPLDSPKNKNNTFSSNFHSPLNSLAIEEIRLRTNRPLSLKIGQDIIMLDYMVNQQEVLQAFEKVCENSVYSYKRQICEGYITIRGGNRVGIVGSAVVENGQVININYISSLNFRIARQKIGCSNNVIENLINTTTNSIYNTLIISPPGCGKTTLLRDIVRNISNGISSLKFKGLTVGVVDERGEIAAMYKGIPQNDVGTRTDIIDNMPKAEAMRILVRSMSPNVIACDEIGSMEDINAIDYAMCSGVKGIFTAHGIDLEEVSKNPELSKLLNKNIFERIILLNSQMRGDTKCIYM